jgi:hypothetical protein
MQKHVRNSFSFFIYWHKKFFILMASSLGQAFRESTTGWLVSGPSAGRLKRQRLGLIVRLVHSPV